MFAFGNAMVIGACLFLLACVVKSEFGNNRVINSNKMMLMETRTMMAPAGEPRGLRNHNPLNIRFAPTNKWRGQVGSDGAFCVFESNVWGYRAAFRVLDRYRKTGNVTVAKVIGRWAPATENNTRAYTRRVCEVLGCGADTELLRTYEKKRWCRLVWAMAVVENGQREGIVWSEIEQAYDMAFVPVGKR